MPMEFDGVVYRTVQDIKSEFKVSDKSLRDWVKKGLIEEPPYIQRGGRRFRHYTDGWVDQFTIFLKNKHERSS